MGPSVGEEDASRAPLAHLTPSSHMHLYLMCADDNSGPWNHVRSVSDGAVRVGRGTVLDTFFRGNNWSDSLRDSWSLLQSAAK
jgi:hypothetical protein